METSGGLFQKAAVGPSYCPEQGPHASKRGKAAASAHLGRASLTPTEGWVSLIQALGETGPPGYLRPLQSEMETSKAPWPLGAPTGVHITAPSKSMAYSVHAPCLRALSLAVPRVPLASWIDKGRMLKGQGLPEREGRSHTWQAQSCGQE